jgi:hypothetical protein
MNGRGIRRLVWNGFGEGKVLLIKNDMPSRGGATLWLGGAWAPPSQRAPPKKKKKKIKKKNKKNNFYSYSLKNL